jgi:branched-chain amino acid transport system substrate-binding protein
MVAAMPTGLRAHGERRRARWSVIIAALFLVGGACVAAYLLWNDDGVRRIYVSLPVWGPDGRDKQTAHMRDAIGMALAQHHSKAGGVTIKPVFEDDSSRKLGGFSVAATARNARRAAEDAKALGYIGDFNSGSTAISISILSAAGIPQISPASTAVGLTSTGRDGGSADPNEPSTYYVDEHTFVRVAPNDQVQADALTALVTGDGCKRLAIISDGGYYGVRLAREVRRSAKDRGPMVAFNATIGTHPETLPGKAASRRSDCFLYSGALDDRTVGLFTRVGRALPSTAKLYGPDGLAETDFTAHLDANIAKRVKLMQPERERKGLGAQFIHGFRDTHDGADPEPYAVYAYESMLLMLDAIDHAGAGAGARVGIVNELFNTSRRRSAIGTYSITEDGDTTKRDYDVYRIRSGVLKYLRTIP